MSIFEQLGEHISNLSKQDKMLLAKYVTMSEINFIFENTRESIAEEAKTRTQSKISSIFTKGYSQDRKLYNSIYYSWNGDNLNILSTKSYFNILNEGFKSFDMKPGLLGKTVPMKLPGGAIIYRKVFDNSNSNPKKKTLISNKNWIHPGLVGAHIDEIVKNEMQDYINNIMRTTIVSIIDLAKDRSGGKIEKNTYEILRDLE